MKANDGISISKKASLLCGADFFGTRAISELDIPRLQLLDGGTGMNFEQLFVDQYASYCEVNGYTRTELDNVAHFYFEEGKLTDRERDLRDYIMSHEELRTGLSGIAPGCYPPGILLGSTWNPDVVRRVGEVLGQEADMYGVDCLLGTPNVNILRDPRNGRFFEGYSEDPYLAGTLGREIVKGVESQGIASDVKHFAANNLEYKRGTINEVISERALREIYLPAFKMCLEAGAATVMTSYPKINGIKATENQHLIREILRDEWHYGGVNMTDWGACTGDSGEAVEAGIDLLMPGPWSDEDILNALSDGRLSKEHLNEAYSRVKNMASKYGYRPQVTQEEAAEIIRRGDKAAYEAAAEGIVLLENNGIFPLKGTEKLVLYGSEKLLYCGRGSAQVFTNRNKALGDAFPVVHYGDDEVFSSEPMSVAIVVCSIDSSEGSDRKDLKLNPETIRVLDRLINVKRSSLLSGRICLVLNTPGPVELGDYINEIDALWAVYYPGMQGAKALVDLMYGARTPSGKLTCSWPVRYEDTPAFLHYPEGDTAYYGEGIFVGYRGYEIRKIAPLYAFGYGLSYTTFDIGNITTYKGTYTADENVTVLFSIENTGEYEGAETVQLYVGAQESSVRRPIKELRAFKKVRLGLGQKTSCELSFNASDLKCWDEELDRFAIEDGIYDIYLGNSSDNAARVLSIKVIGGDPAYRIGIDSYVIKIKDHPQLYSVLMEDIVRHDMDIAILIDAERYTPYTRLSELYPDAAELSEFIRVCSLV